MIKIDSLSGDSIIYNYFIAKTDTEYTIDSKTGEFFISVYSDFEIKDGLYKRYNKNRNLIEIGQYIQNEKDGEWSFYSNYGKIIKKMHFEKGYLNGEYVEYYLNGKISVIGNYKVIISEEINTVSWDKDMPDLYDVSLHGARESINIDTWVWYNYDGTKKKELIYKYY